MKIFGQLVRTVVNVATLPIEVAKDTVDWSWIDQKSHTTKALERIKREAEEDPKPERT